MTKRIHFLNHTSMVLENDGSFLLLDPWPTDSLSFDSWKSHPPCFVNSDILTAFVNTSDSLGIVISHGHDDHCDDSFLKKVSSETPIFLPDYKSKGVCRRLKNDGLNNILEIVPMQKEIFGPFEISTYIIGEHSEDDAVVTIKTDEYFFVHANDNSVKFTDELIEFINRERDDRPIYFASQTGIANGYPYLYPQYIGEKDLDEIRSIVIKKTERTIQTAIDNAKLVGAENFISYAAYTLSMPLLERFGSELTQFLSSPKNIACLDLNWGQVKLLDFVPGDTLNIRGGSIYRPFLVDAVGFEDLCDEILKARLKSLGEFKATLANISLLFEKLEDQSLLTYLQGYLSKFASFVNKADPIVKNDILGSVLEISVLDVGCVSVDFKSSFVSLNDDQQPNKRIIINKDTGWLLVSGYFNFESLYIGHHAEFERYPKEYFNEKLMMQLQVFGYVYQKRLRPSELSDLIDNA